MRAFCWVVVVALWGRAGAWAAATGLHAVQETATDQAEGAWEALQTTPPDTNDSAPMALTGYPYPRVLYRERNGSFPAVCEADGAACIPKCCDLGYTLQAGGRKCVPTDTVFDPYVFNGSLADQGTNLRNWSTDSYNIVIGNPCRTWFRENWTLIDVLSTGQLILYYSQDSPASMVINSTEFCVEESEREVEAIICVDTNEAKVRVGFTAWLYTSGMLVSVSGLLLTLGVYLSVDSLRDLHGKSLICHVGCLAIAYTLLAAVQLSDDTDGFGPAACRRVAFAIQFFLMCSFLWLHVMCLDAFWCVLEATGCSPVPYPRAKKWVYDDRKNLWVTGVDQEEIDETEELERRMRDKRVERRVFAGYSVYVLIMTFLPVLVVLIHKLSPTIPYTYVDHNMNLHCAIHGDKTEESLLYFYPFTALVIVINVMIFICILIKAVSFKWNLTGPQRVPKQKARMCFLLFVLMSSNWVIDVISWSLGGKQVFWVMLHAFYILQGLITFIIFVFEERVKDRIIHTLWPRVRRINKKYSCCHRPADEEEATSLKENRIPSKMQSMGWSLSNN